MMMTYFPSCFSSSFCTGASVNFSFLIPSGRPKWEQRTTDWHPWSRQCWMEGIAAKIRAGFVMANVDLSWGTLKSHLEETKKLLLRSVPGQILIRMWQLTVVPHEDPLALQVQGIQCQFVERHVELKVSFPGLVQIRFKRRAQMRHWLTT